jgi:hypothetical protein
MADGAVNGERVEECSVLLVRLLERWVRRKRWKKGEGR